tara:strand:+ start:5451 stop:6629 length:1179 start_codon:yes stop_codon:yes gene_type:complete
MPDLNLKFDQHGLGDVAHAVLFLQLWKQRGWNITVQIEENKRKVWEVGGFTLQNGGDFPNHPYGYSQDFNNIELPDWRCNKVAFGMRERVLPVIGSQEELWGELCRVRLRAEPGDDAKREASRFLSGLPRPIICLHTRGSNWQERKSLPVETAFNLVLRLLEETGGSVISLDYDGREPIVGHERCKGIIPSWGMIEFDRLAALYSMADLMVGIDSGPFHVASFTEVPCLGVFRELHPVACCVPNPHAAYFVSHLQNDHWDVRSDVWRFLKYNEGNPGADEIAGAALQVLGGVYTSDFCTDAERESVVGDHVYRRIGHDERIINLARTGEIEIGSAGCERRWALRRIDGILTLIITGDDNRQTCRLVSDDNGIWRGKWLHSEQMPIELAPQHG